MVGLFSAQAIIAPMATTAVRAGCSSLALALALAGCSAADPGETDPLDAELIREVSMGQGDLSGSPHSGIWAVEFGTLECDCPDVNIGGDPTSLCELGLQSTSEPVEIELIEGSGVLAMRMGDPPWFGTWTGAVHSDGSYDVAARHELTLLVDPFEVLTRLDGQFSDDGSQTSGWVGQRYLGSFLGDPIDCRQTGTYTGTPL